MHEQDIAIVKSLVSVAWADGVFTDAEHEMIDSLTAAFQATEDEVKDIKAYAAEKKTLGDIPLTELSTDDRRVLLQQAVLLTFVDGGQAESEKLLVQQLATLLRIPEEESRALIGSAEERAGRFLNLL